MAVHINIFGSPGSGKSTMRSRLFYELKKKQLIVEEVVEYAKELTYNERYLELTDQIKVFGIQHHPHFVLDKKVDFVITDSPFVMGFTYIQKNTGYYEELKQLMVTAHNSYNNMNYFLVRNHEYQEFGRNESEEESDKKSLEVQEFLRENNIPFKIVRSGEEFIQMVMKDLYK